MARPRLHKDPAARQAAYRQRLKETTVVVDRRALTRLETKLQLLRDVIHQAATHGDDLARQCKAGTPDTTLDKLIAAFQAKSARTKPPE